MHLLSWTPSHYSLAYIKHWSRRETQIQPIPFLYFSFFFEPSFSNRCKLHNDISNSSEITVARSSLQLGVQLSVIPHTRLHDVRGVHKSQLPWCSPCSFEVGCYWCLEQQSSYPWVAIWSDTSPLLRKFPDICKGKEAFWNFSASTDRLSSIWQNYITDVQQE